MARRFEIVEGGATKYWEIDLRGMWFDTKWGVVGGAEQKKVRQFKTLTAARETHDQMIAQRLHKGWREVDAAAVAAAEKAAAEARARADAIFASDVKLVNAELEAKLAEHPEDKELRAAYAKWLADAGQPWGKVMVLACDGKPAHTHCHFAEDTFGSEDTFEIDWDFGAITRATVTLKKSAEPLVKMLSHPAGRLIRWLTIELRGDAPIGEALAKTGPFPLLQGFFIHRKKAAKYVTDLSQIWGVLPRVDDVRVVATVQLGDIVAPRLETLCCEDGGGAPPELPQEIGAAKLPKVKYLALAFHGSTASLDALEPVLRGEGLPALEHLVIKGWSSADIVDAIATAPIMPRIGSLHLGACKLGKPGLAALVEHAPKLRHLAELYVWDSGLAESDAERITNVLPKTDVSVINWKDKKHRDDQPDDDDE